MALVRMTIAGLLLAGPTALAFFSGGYFDRPRLWGGVVAWVLVAVAAVACPRPLPRTRAGWLALGGLAALTGWTALSILWTPLRDLAQADTQRLLLYLGVLVAAVAVFRERGLARAAEPVLALGALVAIAEGLSERLLPALVTLEQSEAAPGRLFQPLTYWNAMGLLAALGLVLVARIAGDPTRPPALRVPAAAAAPVLAVGVYLPLSRGAVLAAVVGLVVLVALAPSRAQARAVVTALVAAAPAVLAAAVLDGVRALDGSPGARDRDGLIMIAVLAVTVCGAAAVTWLVTVRARVDDEAALAAVRRAARAAVAVTAVATVTVFVLLFTSGTQKTTILTNQATSARLASADSVRADFWQVALRSVPEHPLHGAGAGGFRAEWLQERTFRYAARDAHSLYLETLAELGVVGLAALAAFVAGLVAAARRAYALDPTLATGAAAALTAFAVHAGLDWDWEMPAVSLVAILLGALLVAAAERPPTTGPVEQRAVPVAAKARWNPEEELVS